MRVQLILKGIISPEDWDFIRSRISLSYQRDNYFSELKENEILSGRIQMAEQISPLVGLYYSHDYVRRRVLMQSDSDIEQMIEQIEQEMKTMPNPSEEGQDK